MTPGAAATPPFPGDVLWLEQALADEDGTACAPLAGRLATDVCIIGGGFTGLWTALELRQRHPDVGVALVEAAGCGFGASGRNGGWASGWFDALDGLLAHFPPDHAVWLADEVATGIAQIGEIAATEGFDCGFRPMGGLWAAAAPAQLGAWGAAVAACRALDRADRLELLGADAVRARTGSPLLLGAARHPDAAAVHPGRLARGLRRVALRRGVRLFEGSPVLRIVPGRPAIVQTLAGHVEADQVVVAAGAWSASLLPQMARAYAVIGTHIVATEPVAELLGDTPLARGELLSDAQVSVHYAQVSPDQRMVFGRGFGRLGPGARVIPGHFADRGLSRAIAADLRRWFPQLASAQITHAWGGPVDLTPTHLPFVATLGAHRNLHCGLGYSGNGVAPSVLVGRVLASVATAADDAYAACALAAGPRAWWPPEPLARAGAAVVRAAVLRADGAEAQGHRAGPLSRGMRRLLTSQRLSLPARRRP